MKFLVLSACISLAYCGVITHDDHGKATSYQTIHMEHYHAVPTYVKDKHLLEHPVSVGSSKSKVEVHHGNKHDHGYAVASVHNDVHGHSDGGQELSIGGGHADYHGHEDEEQSHEAVGGYQIQDQGHDYSQYVSQLAEAHSQGGGYGNANLAHYQLPAAVHEDEDDGEIKGVGHYQLYAQHHE